VGKKSVLLFIGLLLPVLVFLFLKYLGKNEFDVPLPHSASVEPPIGCNFEYKIPYTLPDSVIGSAIPRYENLLVLIFTPNRNQLAQMLVENFGTEVKIAENFGRDSVNTATLKRCLLLMPDNADIVVVDRVKRIRGYYASGDRDEVDRLKAELAILLKRY
jgi:hypothetical protein